MHKNILLILSCLCCISISAQVGKDFPFIEGISLTEKTIQLPLKNTDKYSIVGLAYSKRAEDALATWHQPLYDKFKLKRGMFDDLMDVNLFFVPMFTGVKQATFNKTLKKLKESHRTDLFPYLLFYKGDITLMNKVLKMTEKTHPYFYLLDSEGKIVKVYHGFFKEKYMDEIEAVLLNN